MQISGIGIVDNTLGVPMVVRSKFPVHFNGDDINKMVAAGLSPFTVEDNSVSVLETKMKIKYFRKILDKVLLKATVCNTIVDYYGLDIAASQLTPDIVLKECFGGKSDNDEIDGDEIFSLIGIEPRGFEIVQVSDGAMVAMKTARGFTAIVKQSGRKLDSFYVKFSGGSKMVTFLGWERAPEDVFYDLLLDTISPTNMSRMNINIKPVFNIIGKINLSDFVVTSNAKLDKICSQLNLDRKGPKEQIVDSMYEALNQIAANHKSNSKVMFLIDAGYVEVVRGNLKGIDKIEFEYAVGIMARRHGRVILPGNPMFDESTLKDGAVWYVATL